MGAKHIGVIGLGYWGRNIARTLEAMGHAVDTYDTNGTGTFKNVGVLYDRADAIVVATPPDTHYGYASEAIKRGLPVYVEKPMTTDSLQAWALVDEAKQHRVVLASGHQMLSHPLLKRFDEMDRLPVVIHTERLACIKRDDTTAMLSMAPHDLAFAIRLLGDPLHVYYRGVPGDAHLLLEWEGFESVPATRMSIHASWLSTVRTRRMTVAYEDEAWTFEGDTLTRHTPLAGYTESWTQTCEPLREALDEWLYCIDHDAKPRSDGVLGAQVIEAIDRSTLKDAGGE